MGGWRGASAEERRDVTAALRALLLDGGAFGPAAASHFPKGHVWNAPDFGPRLAFEKTGSSWWRRHRLWHRLDGRAFFLNWWYGTLVCVREETLALVAGMPDDYAAMSHFEFFAELYALYHDLDDPLRDRLPESLRAEMKTLWGAPEKGAPARPARGTREPWETIRRPAG
jgi:hypothetical protein